MCPSEGTGVLRVFRGMQAHRWERTPVQAFGLASRLGQGTRSADFGGTDRGMSARTLAELQAGSRGKITGYELAPHLKQRLMELGLTKGHRVSSAKICSYGRSYRNFGARIPPFAPKVRGSGHSHTRTCLTPRTVSHESDASQSKLLAPSTQRAGRIAPRQNFSDATTKAIRSPI